MRCVYSEIPFNHFDMAVVLPTHTCSSTNHAQICGFDVGEDEGQRMPTRHGRFQVIDEDVATTTANALDRGKQFEFE